MTRSPFQLSAFPLLGHGPRPFGGENCVLKLPRLYLAYQRPLAPSSWLASGFRVYFLLRVRSIFTRIIPLVRILAEGAHQLCIRSTEMRLRAGRPTLAVELPNVIHFSLKRKWSMSLSYECMLTSGARPLASFRGVSSRRDGGRECPLYLGRSAPLPSLPLAPIGTIEIVPAHSTGA